MNQIARKEDLLTKIAIEEGETREAEVELDRIRFKLRKITAVMKEANNLCAAYNIPVKINLANFRPGPNYADLKIEEVEREASQATA